MTNEQLVEEFANGATKGKSSSMFIEGNVIYSYGKHFPLAARVSTGFLINTDKFSVTTSKHQTLIKRHLAPIDVKMTTDEIKKTTENLEKHWRKNQRIQMPIR